MTPQNKLNMMTMGEFKRAAIKALGVIADTACASVTENNSSMRI